MHFNIMPVFVAPAHPSRRHPGRHLGAGLFSALLLACCALAGCPAAHAAADAAAAHEVAPTGTLRAAINYGNAVLAVRDERSGALEGVSVDLAREIGKRLGIPVRLVPYATAGSVVEGAAKDAWDVAFTAVDPKRAETIVFSAPYLVIEGDYMVRKDSPIQRNADVDRPGVRVAVSKGSAYDLFLSRTLKHAELVRIADPATVADRMVSQSLDVVAGVKQRNLADAARIPGLRVLEGHFMEIRQAVAVPKGHGAAAPCLAAFMEEMKASGFIRASLARHHVDGVQVAPAISRNARTALPDDPSTGRP